MSADDTTRIWVRWADDGQAMRKWSRTPFAEGHPVDALPVVALDADTLKARFKAFCDAELLNVDWQWDSPNGEPDTGRVLVEGVFNLDALIAAMMGVEP